MAALATGLAGAGTALDSGLAGALVGEGLLEVALGLLKTAGVLAVGLVGVDFVMLVDVLAVAGATLGAGLLVATEVGFLAGVADVAGAAFFTD
jgi:hypothetical protein